jgi:hypothetical protein
VQKAAYLTLKILCAAQLNPVLEVKPQYAEVAPVTLTTSPIQLTKFCGGVASGALIDHNTLPVFFRYVIELL